MLLLRFPESEHLGNLNLRCVLGFSTLLCSRHRKTGAYSGSSSSFTNALLIANFRMLFSSSEEPNTASMAACLPLIFRIHPKVSRPFAQL